MNHAEQMRSNRNLRTTDKKIEKKKPISFNAGNAICREISPVKTARSDGKMVQRIFQTQRTYYFVLYLPSYSMMRLSITTPLPKSLESFKLLKLISDLKIA